VAGHLPDWGRCLCDRGGGPPDPGAAPWRPGRGKMRLRASAATSRAHLQSRIPRSENWIFFGKEFEKIRFCVILAGNLIAARDRCHLRLRRRPSNEAEEINTAAEVVALKGMTWRSPAIRSAPSGEPRRSNEVPNQLPGIDRDVASGVLIWEPSGIFTVGQDRDRQLFERRPAARSALVGYARSRASTCSGKPRFRPGLFPFYSRGTICK
jgi:hypothetical protein